MRWSFFPNTGEWRPMEKRQKKWQGRSGGAWVRTAGRSIYQATLAEEKEKAEAVYRSVVLGLSLAQRKNGSVYRLMENIQEPCIFQVMTLSRAVAREAHRYLGFVRFQEQQRETSLFGD